MKIIRMARIIYYRYFNNLKLKDETNNYYFFYEHLDSSISDLINILESNFLQIANQYHCKPSKKIKVYFYKDIGSFHLHAFGLKSLPKWVVGMADKNSIRLVTPNHDGAVHSKEDFYKIVIHELTHVIIYNLLSMPIPIWLNEGIAVYEARQFTNQSIEILHNRVSSGQIPTLEQLECDFISFGNSNGYEWAYTIVHFIINKFNYNCLVELCRNPLKYEEIFGFSKIEFENKWRESLRDRAFLQITQN